MTTTERKYKGSLTLGKLETVLEAQEALYGTLTKLEAVETYTVGTYDDADYPPLSSLALLPSIGGAAPPASAGSSHMFNGEAMLLGQPIGLSVYRTE